MIPFVSTPSLTARDQAKQQVTQSDFTLVIAQQDLIIRTSVAYFDVLLAENQRRARGGAKDGVSEQLAQAKRNFEVGTATITDANDAQARHDLAVVAGNRRPERPRDQDADAAPDHRSDSAGTGQTLQPLHPGAAQPEHMDNWVEQASVSSLQVRVAQATLDIASQDAPRTAAGICRHSIGGQLHGPGQARARGGRRLSTTPPGSSGCSSPFPSTRADWSTPKSAKRLAD